MPTFLFILYNLFTIKCFGHKGRVIVMTTLPLNYNYHCPTDGLCQFTKHTLCVKDASLPL